VIHGGDGSDAITAEMYQGAGTTNLIYGGDGDDTITALVSSLTEEGDPIGNQVYGGNGGDTLDLFAYSGGYDAKPFNEASGDDGDDRITARIELTMFDESSTASNTLYGGEGSDRLTAIIATDAEQVGHSSLYGGEGDDRLKVSGGTDNFLTGNQGNDTLLGSTGDDRFIGGQGNDYLKGYAGDDTFEFQSARNGERDRIADFTIGEDVMNLSRIDANAFRNGNQAFIFDADGDGGTGRVWVEDYGTRTVVHANTGRAVLDLVLLDGRDVDASDYIASDFIL
jgi:Ca2+-binding RTX toxin-like protein